MNKTMNIVFLDIDGVLNSMNYFENLRKSNQARSKIHNEIDESKLPILRRIVKENNAQIVLSSTWRDLDNPLHQECYEMWKYLIQCLSRYNLKIYDKTPIINQNRPLEIKTWLENNMTIHKEIHWISLDDDFSEENYTKYGLNGQLHLVQTKFFTKDNNDGGLQEKHIVLAKRLFERQRAKKKRKS